MPKDHGVLLSDPYDGGRQIEHAFVRCCHCGYRWIPQPGSGRTRGFCQGCNGVTCGRTVCEARNRRRHLPEEGWLDVAEGTRPESRVMAVR